MRAIKFRGIESDGNWHYGDLEHSPIGKFCRIHEYKDNGYYKGEVDIDPTTIGEFTGLHDKNGKEIYEGDIVRSTRNGFGGVVKWHKRGYFYICEDIFEDVPDHNDDYANLGYILENHPYFEVIGNIHDNLPERLRGGEK